MASFRKCQKCNEKNEVSNKLFCTNCGASIVNAKVIDEEKQAFSDTILILKTLDGNTIKLEESGVVGRKKEGSELLKNQTTVSREHAKLDYKDGKWYIRDLGSEKKGTKNGTYLKGERLQPNETYPLDKGDEICLSRSLRLKVDFTNN